MRFALTAVFVATLLSLPQQAAAHLDLLSPTSRYGPDVLKTGPCGITGGERSDNINYFEPGEIIEVRWDEYVDHPGHYRIAFDPDGDDDFVDPATMTEVDSNEAVLRDGIEDRGAGERSYAVNVTLPNITCDNCTLQVIQVMYDKPPYTTPGNDIYYQCADLVLKVGGAPDAGADAGTGADAGADAGTGADAGAGAGTDAGGCSAVRGAGGGSWSAGLFLFLFLRRLARTRRLPV